MTRPLILASTSRYRRAQLEALGVEHLAVAPEFDEDHTLPLSPEEMVVAFARGKAEAAARRHPGALIVGSDQAPELAGRALTKPGSAAGAVEQLLGLAGRTHRLLTAVALHDGARGRTEHRLVIHQMRMRPLSRELAEAYVARDAPLDCAGAYRIEGLGLLLFEEASGPDHSAIVGLPLLALGELLAGAGVDLLGLALGRGGEPSDRGPAFGA
ncbi:MAG TPA: nucleoside triphosphate pyrophosphatase, partial [Polyangiaceae bacterium]|nr:nucleoside triphosphate pyrophosphatase [Polyangiaceae bacterium]